MWTWAYDIRKKSTDAFMKKYPHIKIDLVSTGTSSDHYTKFQNVVKAGSGIPDIVQTDYDSMPQYAATGSLANISEESIEKEFGSLYADAAWNAVHMGAGLYGIPSDQAPVAMYVRADILEEYGIDVPTTWDEFEEAGKKLHEADPTKYMGVFDTSNAHFMDYFFRAAGVKTYSVDQGGHGTHPAHDRRRRHRSDGDRHRSVHPGFPRRTLRHMDRRLLARRADRQQHALA